MNWLVVDGSQVHTGFLASGTSGGWERSARAPLPPLTPIGLVGGGERNGEGEGLARALHQPPRYTSFHSPCNLSIFTGTTRGTYQISAMVSGTRFGFHG